MLLACLQLGLSPTSAKGVDGTLIEKKRPTKSVNTSKNLKEEEGGEERKNNNRV